MIFMKHLEVHIKIDHSGLCMCKQLVSPFQQLPKQVLRLNVVCFGLWFHSASGLAAALDE